MRRRKRPPQLKQRCLCGVAWPAMPSPTPSSEEGGFQRAVPTKGQCAIALPRKHNIMTWLINSVFSFIFCGAVGMNYSTGTWQQ